MRAFETLGADAGMAIHFGTFPMADDGEGQALQELADALAKARVPASRFWLPAFGEGRDIV